MSDNAIDRRKFLKRLAGGAVSATLLRLGLPSLSLGGSLPPSRPSPMQIDGKSPVVKVHCPKVIGFEGVNRRLLREMIIYGLNDLVGVGSPELALKELFSKKDIIGFKFNSSQAGLLGTNVPLAEELLRLLVRYGYDSKQLLFIEAQPADNALPACGKIQFGWDQPVSFGSGCDSFARVLDQVTAIVNVGLLKANAVAGMSGCLKNISYGLIKHPARFHTNACTPYIADIYQLPMIRNKIRFNLINALRILLRSDLTSMADAVAEEHSLLLGNDIVAVDATGFEILDTGRKKKKFKPLVEDGDYPKQLIIASQKGIGVYHPDQIQVKTIDL